MQSFWHTLPRPLLVLAPMSGYTESPFRRLIKGIEPSTVLVSELISAEGMRRGSEKTLRLCSFHSEEKGYYCVQLFGKSSEAFIDAGQMVEAMGADGIDINLGCPSPKVVGSGHGSALLRAPCTTAEMLRQLVQSVGIPVSVKMRLGFYDSGLLLETVRAFEQAGVQSIAIHGRTTKQKYTGQADWEPIYAVKDSVGIPVIGNGDITSALIAAKKLRHLDGVMIGRASLRNPYIFRQVRAVFDQLARGTALEDVTVPPKPSLPQQLDFYRHHATLSTEFKGEQWAMRELRKHFAHFVRGVRYASAFRERLIRVESRAELEAIFAEIEEAAKH
ncbi:tRNA-dihydrouridine synthase [Candidatus Peribacteria bacterium]|nr:tRNA-dihydrouridine synthase [Candidatus Peribacteria bacterium]